jgi:hypothetical protein
LVSPSVQAPESLSKRRLPDAKRNEVTESPSDVTMFLGVVATRPTAVYISAIYKPFLVIPESLTNAPEALGLRNKSVENFFT